MNKKAMAIEIVLIFATIMGFMGMFIIKSSGSNNKQLELSTAQLQSYFVARAGVEHAMLKIKYLHRELYDAICMYQGRNPLFNYTGINVARPYESICATNPGPIFLYQRGEFTPMTNSIITKIGGGSYSKYKDWLEAFTEDLDSTYADNTCLNFKNLDKSIIKAMTPEDGTGAKTFSAQYKLHVDKTNPENSLGVSAFKTSENKKGQLENNIVIHFTMDSIFTNSKGVSFDYQISRTVTISRD